MCGVAGVREGDTTLVLAGEVDVCRFLVETNSESLEFLLSRKSKE